MCGKILVIRGGAIGDFILTLPAIAALRGHFPKAHLEVLGYPHIVQLAHAAGLVDRVQPIEARSLAGFFARNGELSENLADYFSEFDVIISYLYDPDEIFQTNLSRCTVAQFIAGPHRPEETTCVHASKIYLKPLERLAIFDADHIPHLVLHSQSCGGVDAQEGGSLPKRIGLHPGSGSERKNWPEAKWFELLQQLMDSTDYSLLLIGGEAEGGRLQRLAATLPSRRMQVAQSLALVALAELMQGCSLFCGHDSGISHLAAALGLRGVVLWGDTAEEIWRPPNEKMIVLRHPQGLASLEVRTVLGAICGSGR